MLLKLVYSLIVIVLSVGCAALGELGALVQPPRFEQVPWREAEIRLLGPSLSQPIGGPGCACGPG